LPLYEFLCTDCNQRFEKLCRQQAQDQIKCPECGTMAKRVFSTFRATVSGNGDGGSIGGGGGCGPCSSSGCSSCS